ncbi:MAG: hypothetical protein WAT37_10740 [Saprospiraceae bacterium]
MARLYYDQSIDGVQLKGPGSQGQNFDSYLEKVSKLVPSEIIAGYLTMMGFVPTIKSFDPNIISWIIFGAGLILTPFYLNKVASVGKPKRNHLILSTVAFAVWAYVTTGPLLFESSGMYDSAIASITLVLFSLISGIVPLNK